MDDLRLRPARSVVPWSVIPTPTVFQRSVLLRAPLEAVYRFHLDPANLARISPPGVRLERIEVESPIRVGSQVNLVLRFPGGLRQEWRVEIAVMEPGVRLVDVALQSPFVQWRHEHRFEAVAGGTRMTDRVEYVPAGNRFMRRLAGVLWRPQLAFLFGWRHWRTRALLEGVQTGKGS